MIVAVSLKAIASHAVGFDKIDLDAARCRSQQHARRAD
jgi:lactate dehydrogenase-like 2-hydroxyacid dehydrogenase